MKHVVDGFAGRIDCFACVFGASRSKTFAIVLRACLALLEAKPLPLLQLICEGF